MGGGEGGRAKGLNANGSCKHLGNQQAPALSRINRGTYFLVPKACFSQELILVWIAILSEANDWFIFLRGEQRRRLI